MRWLLRIYRWAVMEKMSDRERNQEREFIDAANKLKTLKVTARGGMSIDPEEIRDQIQESREALRHLVSPSHRRPVNAQQQLKRETKTPNERGTGDYVQVITWRHLPSKTSVRYVCLQSMDEDKFAIAVSDFFSGDNNPHHDSFEHRVAQRLRTVELGEPLAWYDSLQEAMDAHDADI